MRWIFFLIFPLCAADFDCILIGTSPFSLFEALYQYHSGKTVLILEEAPLCGGAWKGIDICGLSHVDLGCHHIGDDVELKNFLEMYTDCRIVSMDHPFSPFDPKNSSNGWYFSKGCYELIDSLLRQIRETGITLLTETKAEEILIDPAQKIATVFTPKGPFTSHKVIVTPMSHLSIHPSLLPPYKSRYPHLYMLIEDPKEPQFTYQKQRISGLTRMMNLTHFAGLTQSGKQLIVVQSQSEKNLSNPQEILGLLKTHHLIDELAHLICAELFIYEAGTFHQNLIREHNGETLIELLQTGHLKNLAKYIPKWKVYLKRI